MRLLGSSIAIVGVLLLALLGWQVLGMNPPSILGLSLGQMLVVLAAIITLGLGITALADRRGNGNPG